MLTCNAVEYVTCKICKSPDTILDKENRLYFMTCESCGSRMCFFLPLKSWYRLLMFLPRTIRVCDQDWFPGANRKKDQGGIRQKVEEGFRCVICILCISDMVCFHVLLNIVLAPLFLCCGRAAAQEWRFEISETVRGPTRKRHQTFHISHPHLFFSSHLPRCASPISPPPPCPTSLLPAAKRSRRNASTATPSSPAHPSPPPPPSPPPRSPHSNSTSSHTTSSPLFFGAISSSSPSPSSSLPTTPRPC